MTMRIQDARGVLRTCCITRTMRHKASKEQNHSPIYQEWGGVMVTERRGGKCEERCLEGSRKNVSPAHTPKGSHHTVVCVGVQRPW
jgi:hypothetical protein